MKHVAPISGLSCVQGRYVATAGYDNQLILWDAEQHVSLARVSHDHLANQCMFSDDGQYLVSASSDYSARIWSVPSLRLVAVLGGHEDDVEMASFAPDSQSVATCSRDHNVRIFDLQGRLLTVCKGHEADVISVTWMPDGQQLISSSDDGTVRRWDVASGKELHCTQLDGVETDTLIVTETGMIVAGDDEGRLTVILNDESVASIAAHKAGIKRLTYSKETKRLVSLSYDRSMKIWAINGSDLVMVSSAPLPSMIWPRSCAFLGDNSVVFATFGSTYAAYDVQSNQWLAPDYVPSLSLNSVFETEGDIYTIGDAGTLSKNFQPMTELGSLCNFVIHVGGVTLCGGQMGCVYDGSDGRVVYQHHSPLNCVSAFVRDGVNHFAIGTYTGEVIILRETDNSVEFVTSVSLHPNAIKGLASDGIRILGVSADRASGFINCESLKVEAVWEDSHTQIANACAVVDTNLFCTVSRDLKLRLWNEKGCFKTVDTPNENSLKCVAASQGYIIIGDYGGRISIYDYKNDFWLNTVRPTTWGISSLCPSSDGSVLASSYDDSIYRLLIGSGGVKVSEVSSITPAKPIRGAA